MGFKMRSGNGPLAFKNMGSSPANVGVTSIVDLSRLKKDDDNVIETDYLFQKSRVEDQKPTFKRIQRS